jgi:hypothetical protein
MGGDHGSPHERPKPVTVAVTGSVSLRSSGTTKPAFRPSLNA